ncbi:hypothetical protein GGI04_001202 [Coemansia thaxteri]|uniref:Uncharacterized protein n=1 Tax=Coemansia thaxteri TaxID=2663907 RepID=A0A9W8EGC2_9FUNG|nr:hypothetical protein H4R26_002031 [Coemansia thaxteri]KAJ2008279.1 hypothetical protein GGI04_001202 [Coemansia thaxteri]KAJ2473113.1 hypothetical protein GGI02_001094 [Coemansia sp. RSA 2322]KAJ2485218.1 hypothetical protein EV174_001882 [Coemansia sp. RSA 2320]
MPSASDAVALATRVLFLRTTTQIDLLMEISSSPLSQRWDFLGPPTTTASGLSDYASFFHDVDAALQWQTDNNIGDYIRHSHYALELTEEQAEILCAANVRLYNSIDEGEQRHALVPFAVVGQATYAVDLLWEHEQWRYFNTVACNGRLPDFELPPGAVVQGTTKTKSTIEEEDDSYWGQWDDDDDEREETVPSNEPQPQPQHSLLVKSVRLSLAAAAATARAAGLSDPEFLSLAADALHSQAH